MPSLKKETASTPVKKTTATKTVAKSPKVAEEAAIKTEKITSPKTESPQSTCTRVSCSLVVLIIFIASIFSASFVFAGLKLYPAFFITQESNTKGLDTAIDEGIKRFVQKQQGDQQASEEAQQKETEQKAQAVPEFSESKDRIRGDVNAKVSIIEYSDFECPYCKRNHPTVKQVFEKYDGKVNWIYRHLPLPFHAPNAMDEAEASECVAALAGDEAFWKFNDLIYERTPSNKGFTFEKLQPLAEEVGVNGSKFDACMKSDKHLPKIQQNMKEAESMGIQGTPANLIRNNKTGEVKFLGGAYPAENFEAIIDAMLK